MAKIEIEGLSKVYNPGAQNEVKALDNISFSLEDGEFTVILGASGAGKSTLLNILGGMDTASEGHYKVDGEDVAQYKDKQLSLFRRKDVGFVFQFYNLLPQLTALENVALAASVAESPFEPRKILSDVGLSGRLNNFPSELSGGEQQRVAIARAIVKNPKLLLCDEPTGALDTKTGVSILFLLLDLSKQFKKNVIMVTHNSKIAEVGERLIRIADGHIASDQKIDNPLKLEEVVW